LSTNVTETAKRIFKNLKTEISISGYNVIYVTLLCVF